METSHPHPHLLSAKSIVDHKFFSLTCTTRIKWTYGNQTILTKEGNLVLSSLWRGTSARNVSFETLNDGQFTLSTQLIIPNYLAILSHRCSTTVSLETYPPYWPVVYTIFNTLNKVQHGHIKRALRPHIAKSQIILVSEETQSVPLCLWKLFVPQGLDRLSWVDRIL